jgi:hypothetical protein
MNSEQQKKVVFLSEEETPPAAELVQMTNQFGAGLFHTADYLYEFYGDDGFKYFVNRMRRVLDNLAASRS